MEVGQITNVAARKCSVSNKPGLGSDIRRFWAKQYVKKLDSARFYITDKYESLSIVKLIVHINSKSLISMLSTGILNIEIKDFELDVYQYSIFYTNLLVSVTRIWFRVTILCR
jgi:hypothetical protein